MRRCPRLLPPNTIPSFTYSTPSTMLPTLAVTAVFVIHRTTSPSSVVPPLSSMGGKQEGRRRRGGGGGEEGRRRERSALVMGVDAFLMHTRTNSVTSPCHGSTSGMIIPSLAHLHTTHLLQP